MTIDGFIAAVARKVRKTKQKGFLADKSLVRFGKPDSIFTQYCPIEFLAGTESGTAGDTQVRVTLGLTAKQQEAIMTVADKASRSKYRKALLRACGIRVAGRS